MNKCEPCKHYKSTNDFYYHCDAYNSFFVKRFAEMRRNECKYFDETIFVIGDFTVEVPYNEKAKCFIGDKRVGSDTYIDLFNKCLAEGYIKLSDITKEKEQETMKKELKFKVGDKVKVIHYSHSLAASGQPKNLIGEVFEITKVDINQTEYPYQVGFLWFKEYELEAVEKQPKFKVGDLVEVLDVEIGRYVGFTHFIEDMVKYIGKSFTIKEVHAYKKDFYFLNLNDGDKFTFHESWLKLVEDKKTCEDCEFYCKAKYGFFCEEDKYDISWFEDDENDTCNVFKQKEEPEPVKTCEQCKFYMKLNSGYFACTNEKETRPTIFDYYDNDACVWFEEKE